MQFFKRKKGGEGRKEEKEEREEARKEDESDEVLKKPSPSITSILVVSSSVLPQKNFKLSPGWFLTFLYSRRRVRCFYFLLLKKIISFLGAGGNEGPSPSLALVSIVFVLLTSVQDLLNLLL